MDVDLKHAIVIGGGISGLAAAHALTRQAGDVPGGLRVTVLERAPEVGGKARSERDGGWLVEHGPIGYLDSEPRMAELVSAAGLTPIHASAAAARRFVVRGGRMREIQPHPLRFARSGILGPLGLLRAAREPWVRRGDPTHESVWDFAARRLGPQLADRLIAPMVLGVFAGDAKSISVEAAFPKMTALEREHGSLFRAMASRRKAGMDRGRNPAMGGSLTSFADGLQSLPRSLAARGGFEVRTDAAVTRVRRESERWRVDLEADEPVIADALVVATEARPMAELLSPIDEEMGRSLQAVKAAPLAVVAMAFQTADAAAIPRGFGVLIPRDEGFTSLGCLWESHIFPERSNPAGVFVRSMVGGAVAPELAELADDELLGRVRDDLRRLHGLTASPIFARVVRWREAIPQYDLEHPKRARQIEDRCRNHPGLFLAGNGLHGVAFAKTAVTGLDAGDAAARWLWSPTD